MGWQAAHLTSMSFAIIYTLTIGRTRCEGGRGVEAIPVRFFWDFSKRIKHQHLTFSVTVRLCLARILRQVQWWSVSMVTKYDVMSSRWSSHFEWKCVFFSTFFNNESKSCGWNNAKCLFMCYYSCQAITISGKIHDGENGWWRHTPPAAPPLIKYTSSC